MLSAALAGCGGTRAALEHERSGRPHLAYEEYLRAAAKDPSDGAAAAGLRRTAPPAAAWWQQQAFEAAERADWQRAAACHLKVLRIKPDEPASIAALRRLARTQGEAVRQAYAAAAPQPPAAAQVAAAPPGPPATPPNPPPAQRPPEVTAAPPRADPRRQHLTARRVRGAADGDFRALVRVSRDDDRYPKKAPLAHGLSVKVRDTDDGPIDADLEVYLGSRRIGRLNDVPAESVIDVLDEKAQAWQIVIVRIYDPDETVTVGLRRKR
jgi:hypothetical protein